MNFLDPRLPDRFWNKVIPEPNSGCWIWTAASNGRGYGQIKRIRERVNALAHRMSYECLVGPIPADLEIDHVRCRTRCCVNPAHMEVVTSAVNARRAVAVRQVLTHCKHGHEFTVENTYLNGKQRNCKTCRRTVDRIRDARPERIYSARRKEA